VASCSRLQHLLEFSNFSFGFGEFAVNYQYL